MKVLRLVLAALVCTTPLLAAAQWIYLDQAGRKVFSDQAPPPDVAANRILHQPGAKPSAMAAETTAAPAVAAASATRPSGVDKSLEARKKQADAEVAAKKRADEEKVAQLRADNCTRARGAKADFQSGARILRTNDKGEREVMDDQQRDAEVRRFDAIIASDCAK